MQHETLFDRYIGIDYSGRETSITKLPQLAVYSASGDQLPKLVRPKNLPGDNWSRKEIAERLVEELPPGCKRTLVGIDHAYSFPWMYFQHDGKYVGPNWEDFLVDFLHYWPTCKDSAKVRVVLKETGKERSGSANWKRRTEELARATGGVFNFKVPLVSHSTHAGIPWLLYIRRKLGERVHFWPFDGLDNWEGKSVIAEVYPALWNRQFSQCQRTDHQHDAYSVARWLSEADHFGFLERYLKPTLNHREKEYAAREGCILGIPGCGRDAPPGPVPRDVPNR